MQADLGQRAFRRALAITGASAALVAAAAALLLPLGAIDHLRGMASELCITLTHIASDIASVSLVLFASSALLAGLFALVASATLQRRALAAWQPLSGPARRRVSRIARSRGIGSVTVVFDCHEPIACSRGILAPEIWLSRGAVDVLSDEELAAVLAHEHQHCLSRDPAKRQLLEVLARALFAFPVVAQAARAFRRAAEYAADDAAARATSGRNTARALLRFAATPSVPALVQFGASVTVGERVQRLLGETPTDVGPDRRAWTISAIVAATAILCIAVVAALPTEM